MNQHDDLESLPWPWPTREEAERFHALLGGTQTRLTDHRGPDAAFIEHPDGQCLWATFLDAPYGSPAPVSSLEGQPLVATSRDELVERVKAVQSEALVYGVRLGSPRSPMRANPNLARDAEALDRAVSQHGAGRR